MTNKPLITEFFNRYKYDDIEEYIKLGGFSGINKVISEGKNFAINELKEADIKGRGGAEYPAWRKWLMAKERDGEKVILCNADEGEPGSFKDRDLLNKDPYKVIEGMIIAAYVIGAKRGYIYIREEYDHIRKKFITACDLAKSHGLLGDNILDQGFDFDIKVNTGAGAYICGENTALIESMMGKVGRPRLKPPRVGEKGLFGLPTMVNNVETFVCATTVMIHGSEKYCSTGTVNSKGNKVISISGRLKSPGTYEVPFGITVDELINEIGGGPKGDYPIKFIQSGGASGPLIPTSMFHIKYSYEDFEENGFSIGAGSMVVVDEKTELIDYLIAIEEFFKHESCGKCTPCREGLVQVVKILYKIKQKTATLKDMEKLERVSQVMVDASFCGLGVTAPTAIFSAFKYYKDELYKDVEMEDVK